MNLTAAFDAGQVDDLDSIDGMLDESDAADELAREEFRRGLLAAIGIAPATTVH